MPMPSGTFRNMDRKELLGLLRSELKKEKPVRKMLKRHGLDDSVIDFVSVRFAPLDVSAKTVDGNIILNDRLLDSELREIIKYLSHELCHVGQQLTSDVRDEQGEEYLDQDGEVEAFKTQVDVMEEMYSPAEIQNYLEGLTNHHGLEGEDRLRKIRELKQ
jgi:hypothetical protein